MEDIGGMGGARGYNFSHPILTIVEDEEMRSGALEKWYLLAEARVNKANR